MEGSQTDRQTDKQGDPSVTPGLPTSVVRTHQGSGGLIPLGEWRGSADVWWIPTCCLLSSSLKASEPSLLRACPPRRQRVPGACPVPDACPQEELHLARVPRTSRDTSAGPPVSQALTGRADSVRHTARCRIAEEPARCPRIGARLQAPPVRLSARPARLGR